MKTKAAVAVIAALSGLMVDQSAAEDGLWFEYPWTNDRFKIGRYSSPRAARLREQKIAALPREATDKFLAKFGVQRIKDLPTSQVEKARAFVEQLRIRQDIRLRAFAAPGDVEQIGRAHV